MRGALPLVLMFVLILGTAPSRAGSRCSYDGKAPIENTDTANGSNFRGISFESSPRDVEQIVRALEFDADIMHYVGSQTLVSGINIYKSWEEIGTVSFDRHGQVLRLSLKDRFFCAEPVFVRHFVDELFEHYGVKPIKQQDDACFQDVTCFKGISKFGEQFLILRIGAAAELYVRPSP